MKGQEMKAESIAELIVDSILEERTLNKQALLPKVSALIRIFVKGQSAPQVKLSHLSQASVIKHVHATEINGISSRHWHSIVKDLVTPERLAEHYAKQNELIATYKQEKGL